MKTLALLLFLCVPAAPVAAQDWEQVVIRSGALLATVTSEVQLDPEFGQSGTGIDLERDLGFTNRAGTFLAEGTWRVRRRHQVHASYLTASRDTARTLVTRPFTFGNVTFNVNTRVDASSSASFFSVDYGFALIATPAAEIGASIGVSTLSMDTQIAVSPEILGRTLGVLVTEEAGFTEPMVLPGVFLNLRPQGRVRLSGSVRYIGGTIKSAEGSAYDARLGVDVLLTPRFGVGASYYRSHAEIDRRDDVFNGHAEFELGGPQFFGVVTF